MNTNTDGIKNTTTDNAAAGRETTTEKTAAERAKKGGLGAGTDEWWARLSATEKDFLRVVGGMVADVGIEDDGQVVEVYAGTRDGGEVRFLLAQRMTEWGKNARRLKRPRSVERMLVEWGTLHPKSPRALFGFATPRGDKKCGK